MIEICGVLVHSRPERVNDVRSVLGTMPGVEVHAATEEGRLVITLENSDENSRLSDGLAEVSRIDGVLGTALVYEHSEQEDEPTASKAETIQ